MRITNLILLFLAFLLSSFQIVFAQETPEIFNLKQKSSIGQNQIWGIAQGNDRLMLFAHSGGLLLFDGANWDTLQLPEKQIIRCVEKGKNEEIFVGGYGEFGFWKKDANSTFKYFSLSKNIPLDKVHKEEIWHILPVKDAVYFQSFSTLYKYDYKNVEIITPPTNIMFLQSVGERLFIQGIGQGVFELRRNSFEFCAGTELLGKETVVSILSDSNNQLLLFTANNGVFVYDFQQVKTWNNGYNEVLKKNQINRCKLLYNNDLVIGTIQNGLYLFDAQGSLKYHLSRENGLQNNTILSLFEDNNQTLWLGLDQGVDRIALNTPLRFFRDFSDNIGAIYAAALLNERLFIGTNRGVFFKNDSGKFQFVEGTQGQVWYLQNIDNQLVCGHNNGTFLIQSAQKIQKISSVTGGWIMRKILATENAWLQGTYTGLVLFRKETNGNFVFDKRISGFSEPIKNLIVEDKQHFWVANPYKGFYRLRLSADYQRVENIEELDLLGQKSSTFKVNLSQLNNQIYIHTKLGVFVYNTNTNKLEHITQLEKIDVSKESFIGINGIKNEFFIAFKDKVFWQNTDKKLQLPLSLIPDYECIIPLNEQTYLFGMANGYCLLQRSTPSTTLVIPQTPLISKVALHSGTKIYPTSNNAPLSFQWLDNGMEFSFGQPEMLSGVRFRYQLEGYENKWSDWQTRPSKEFTNLAPGDYIFKVQSDVATEIAQFPFRILPPWYRTIWAKLFYAICGIAALYSIQKWLEHRLEKQKAKIELDQQLHLEQLRLQNENQLLQAKIQSKTKELANSTMNLVEKNEILLKIKETLNEVKREAGTTFPSKYYQRLINSIDTHLSSEQDWLLFETNFNEVHEQFFKRLIHDFPDLTPSDLKLAAYLKMNLSSKELAPLFNISLRGVENKRYRLRQKLNLQAEDNIVEFLLKY